MTCRMSKTVIYRIFFSNSLDITTTFLMVINGLSFRPLLPSPSHLHLFQVTLTHSKQLPPFQVTLIYTYPLHFHQLSFTPSHSHILSPTLTHSEPISFTLIYSELLSPIPTHYQHLSPTSTHYTHSHPFPSIPTQSDPLASAF